MRHSHLDWEQLSELCALRVGQAGINAVLSYQILIYTAHLAIGKL